MYVGHLLAYHQTSLLGSILVIFSALVTIGVAAYLYHEFRAFKRRSGHEELELPLEAGETEFEIAPGTAVYGKGADETALVTGTSDDDFFFDEEEEIGR